MEKLIAMGSLDAGTAAVLQILVQAGYNIFISGGTGSGKTTMLNALSDFVPKDARIVTIDYKVTFLYLFVKLSNILQYMEHNIDISKC